MQISEARNEQTRARIKRQNTAIIHQRRGGGKKGKGKKTVLNLHGVGRHGRAQMFIFKSMMVESCRAIS